MDGCGWMWMDGWIGRSIPVISHSAKSNSIQWYTLLVCPSLSFLGRYLEDTEHCYLIMPGMYIMTLNANIGLLGFCEVIKIWSNAVNERVEDVTSMIVRVLPLRLPLCIYIQKQILHVPSIMKCKLTVDWPWSYVTLTGILILIRFRY